MALPPKPPGDKPVTPKPAARRGPRTASTTRRAPPPKPEAASEPAKVETPPAAKSQPRAKAPTAPRAKAAPPLATQVAKDIPATVSNHARAWTIGALVAAAGTGLFAFLTRERIAEALAPAEGHVPTDLTDRTGPSLAKEGDERAIPAFRPDMDAPMTDAEREALRPATGPAPSLVEDRGSMNAQTGPSN